MRNINYNGKILPAESPIISAHNRGLKYGDGLFETMRVIDGRIPFANYHFKRLKHGLKTLGMSLPRSFTFAFFKKEILSIAGNEKARVRLTVFRKEGGLYLPTQNKFNYLIETKPLADNEFGFNPKGIHLGLAKSIQLPCNQLSPLKTINALPYVIAAQERKKLKTDDILLLNQYGRIAEANSSNLFLWTGRILRTPQLSEGVINGVIRSVLIDKAARIGVKVKEDKLSLGNEKNTCSK